jgi:hypothetical protein
MDTSRWVLDNMASLHGTATWSDDTFARHILTLILTPTPQQTIDTYHPTPFARMNACLAQFSDGRHDLQKVQA